MRFFMYCVCLGVLSAQAMRGSAQTTNTNGLRLHVREHPPAKALTGEIATNTPAFEKYGFHLMLGEINHLRTNWHLDIPEPLTTNNVYITLRAKYGGVGGSVATRDGRFRWMFTLNTLDRFVDTNYFTQSFNANIDTMVRLSKTPSKITAREAEAIARKRLHELGLTEKKLKLIEPPEVYQYKLEEMDGTIHLLPIFHVAWHDRGFEDAFPNVTFDISGITKQVAEYFNTDINTPYEHCPTNYYEMLGVRPPTNFSQRMGIKPLDPLTPPTNSAAK